MTEIRIKRLGLENFKCHDRLSLELNGRNAVIYGDNATGKTSIYDALTWLLFGKDSSGNGEKNIEVKPLDKTGAVRDHEALTQVEAVLDIDGVELSLRRTYQEVWTTKRGSSQATYDGNTSEYYIDGVPLKCSDYTEKVSELVHEDLFRMLTSIHYFSSQMRWQERRAVLFDVAGVLEDAAILATAPRFTPLLDSLGKLTLDEYKRKLLAEKKQFVGTKNDIPSRISECQKTVSDVAGLDFNAARNAAAKLQADIEAVSAQILSLEHNTAVEQKRMEIQKEKLALTALENENRAFRAAQSAGQPDVHSMEIRITALQTRLARENGAISNEKDYIQKTEKKIADARQQWISLSNSSVDISETCHACGQPLPADAVQRAQAAAEAQKKERLDQILSTANAYKETKLQAEARLSKAEEDATQIREEIRNLQQKIQDAESSAVPVSDMPDYEAKRDAYCALMQSLSEDLATIEQDSYLAKEKLRHELDACKAQLLQQNSIISKEALLEYAQNRITALRADAQNAAEGLEAVEKMLWLIEDYTRYKTQFVEESVNQHFRIARFRLFREQANGGVEERCDVVHNGIPYIGVNNGMKINLGIDIINTLSHVYGVKVPLFVDNAESVTNLEACGSQTIRMVVSEKDKELNIRYES